MLNPSPSKNIFPLSLGETEAQNLAFGSHLQQFNTKVNQLCDRVAQNQLSGAEAHGKIEALLCQLKHQYQDTIKRFNPNQEPL